MDKNTLSNYGWIVIAVLVLSVMIAFATPFGQYIANGAENTLFGLINTSDNAFEATGLLGNNNNNSNPNLTREEGKPYFNVPYMLYGKIVDGDNNEYPMASVVFYENGSASIYQFNTQTITRCNEGYLKYENDKIINVETGVVEATLSTNGKTVKADDIEATLNENTYSVTQNVAYEGSATVVDDGDELTLTLSMKLNNDGTITVKTCLEVDGQKQEGTPETMPAGSMMVNNNIVTLKDGDEEFFIGFLTSNETAIVYIEGIGIPMKLVEPADPTTNHTTIANGAYYGNIPNKMLYDEMPSEPTFGDFYLYGEYAYLYIYDKNDPDADPTYDGWWVGLATLETENDYSAQVAKELCPDFKTTTKLKTSYSSPLETVAGKPAYDGNSLYIDCVNLTADGVPKIPDTMWNVNFMFKNCGFKDLSGIENKLPKTAKYYTGLFEDCTSLKTTGSFTIPNNVECTAYMFAGCSSLTDASGLSISDNLTDAQGMFARCTSLTNSGIPNLNKIENLDAIFSGCESLKYFDGTKMSSKAVDISNMFSGCSSLVSFDNFIIPNTVTDMRETFYECTSLITAPVIPSSVKNIRSTFQDCTSLTGDVIINTTPDEYDLCFYGTEKPINLKGTCAIKDVLARVCPNITIG